MKHILPHLPYNYAALEPHVDARTMMLHHGRHHASYVENLNAALEPFPELKYENRRGDYLKDWWAVANWEEASRRFEGAGDHLERVEEADALPAETA